MITSRGPDSAEDSDSDRQFPFYSIIHIQSIKIITVYSNLYLISSIEDQGVSQAKMLDIADSPQKEMLTHNEHILGVGIDPVVALDFANSLLFKGDDI